MKKGRIVKRFNQWHLGDFWCRLNYLLREVETDHRDRIYEIRCVTEDLYNFVTQLYNLLDLPEDLINSIEINSKPGGRRAEDREQTYKCKYFETKKKWSITDRKVICYSFDASWKANLKIPPDISNILHDADLKDYKFIKVGLPRTIEDIIDLLSICDVLVTVDNGIAHLARSVKCPTIIVEHKWGLDRGFPRGSCEYIKGEGTEGTLTKLKLLLLENKNERND